MHLQYDVIINSAINNCHHFCLELGLPIRDGIRVRSPWPSVNLSNDYFLQPSPGAYSLGLHHCFLFSRKFYIKSFYCKIIFFIVFFAKQMPTVTWRISLLDNNCSSCYYLLRFIKFFLYNIFRSWNYQAWYVTMNVLKWWILFVLYFYFCILLLLQPIQMKIKMILVHLCTRKCKYKEHLSEWNGVPLASFTDLHDAHIVLFVTIVLM